MWTPTCSARRPPSGPAGATGAASPTSATTTPTPPARSTPARSNGRPCSPLDRGGDFLSTTLQVGAGSRLDRLAEVRNPHSLGEVYSALTWYLGFEPNADEGKTMGLAPYGRDKLVGELADLVSRTRMGCFG
jgi:Carbamoyltransferase N-terminus